MGWVNLSRAPRLTIEKMAQKPVCKVAVVKKIYTQEIAVLNLSKIYQKFTS